MLYRVAVKEYAADSCANECKEQQEAAQLKLTATDTDGQAKLKVRPTDTCYGSSRLDHTCIL